MNKPIPEGRGSVKLPTNAAARPLRDQAIAQAKSLEVLDESVYFELLGKTKQSWDDYYMRIAYMVSTRSIDPSTKHGCVIVDENYVPISFGYNGPPANIDDIQVPLTRPDKYAWMIHAEENAMYFAKNSLKDSIVYITGPPCSKCTRGLVQNKVGKIIYGDTHAKCVDDIDLKHSKKMLELAKIPTIHHSIF